MAMNTPCLPEANRFCLQPGEGIGHVGTSLFCALPRGTATEKSYDEQWINELLAIVLEGVVKFDFKMSDPAFQMHISERTLYNQHLTGTF